VDRGGLSGQHAAMFTPSLALWSVTRGAGCGNNAEMPDGRTGQDSPIGNPPSGGSGSET